MNVDNAPHWAHDAYMLESPDGETIIIDQCELNGPDYRPADGWRMVSALDTVRSIDHGLRTAEGTAVELIGEAAALIMGPILAAAQCESYAHNYDGLAWQAIYREFGLVDDATSGCTRADDPDDAQALYEAADYEFEPMLADCGYVVETSADCGMTWIYRPVGIPDWVDAGTIAV